MDEEERIFRKVGSIVREENRSTYIGEDDLVHLTQRGIVVNFHLKHEKLDIINIFRTIKRTQKMVREKLAYDIQDLTINIYKSGTEMLRDGGMRGRYASWAAGLFDGEITLVSEEDDEEEARSLYIYLTHEIVHLAVYEIAMGRCPFWLDEGLAVYLSQELPDSYLEVIRGALKADGSLPDLKDLERPSPEILEDEYLRKLAYGLAACAVECMVTNPLFGWQKVNLMLAGLGRKDVDEVLFGLCLNYELIGADLERWVRKKTQEIYPDRERIR